MAFDARTAADPVAVRNEELGYPIVIGPGVLSTIPDLVREGGGERNVILCDRNIEPYAHAIARMLHGTLAVIPVHLGERRKTWETVGTVLEELARSRADRSTLVIGVGGGVAGDAFGFAASVFMRGVRFLNVATSLVAMVDAAIGGKTGVDLRAGKNLAGTFRDPIAVVCDTGLLATLPKEHLREGMAEVVKHAIIDGERAFGRLEALDGKPRAWPWESIVAESIGVKTRIVAGDPFESNTRALLNLGHTVGHAIERVSEYRVPHGRGVAIGLRAAGLMAQSLGQFAAHDHRRILALLGRIKLPLCYEKLDGADIFAAMQMDKKRAGGEVRFVLPITIGRVEYGRAVPPDIVRAAIERCAHAPAAEEVP